MTRHYSDLGSPSDWSCRVGNLIYPNRSPSQIWVVTCHQYGISAFVSQTSFGGKTSCSFQISIWRISQLESDVLSFALYVMLKFSNFILEARLRQTANANIYHVTKCLLYCSFAIYYLLVVSRHLYP